MGEGGRGDGTPDFNGSARGELNEDFVTRCASMVHASLWAGGGAAEKADEVDEAGSGKRKAESGKRKAESGKRKAESGKRKA
ncbi:hypothetical protein [Burkholderia diffusa]|uniref:hypothetical protein n=1 Tax=Burkholderia diffusa TaxID=488732 RepID=UPI002AB25BE3|nr:hypothetical protein [Burkholderia diffusa]